LRADKTQMNRLFTNLFQNAVEACEKDQCIINVNEFRENGSVVVSVKDNGEGIPEDKIDNLFDKFYQVDVMASRKYGGTGLGLAICKEIIDAHEGKIWAHNNSDGKGATFSFKLPLPVHK